MKNIFLILSLLPISVFAQSPSQYGNGFELFSLVIILITTIIIFLLCREIICWYWKINKFISNQEEIIRLLKKIAGENSIEENKPKED